MRPFPINPSRLGPPDADDAEASRVPNLPGPQPASLGMLALGAPESGHLTFLEGGTTIASALGTPSHSQMGTQHQRERRHIARTDEGIGDQATKVKGAR
jgi:hypothetical protein